MQHILHTPHHITSSNISRLTLFDLRKSREIISFNVENQHPHFNQEEHPSF